MIKTLSDIDCTGKKVLVRCDFNVPLKDGVIQDDTRITAALPTISELLKKDAAVILMSHLGRPKGQIVPQYSLSPVVKSLSELLKKEVKFCPEAYGDKAGKMGSELQPGDVMLLENLRFYDGEEKNDPDMARGIACLGNIFVQDAFGTVHRAHASMVGVPSLMESVAGRLLQKEVEYLSKGLNPEHPMCLCLGGAKLETKIPIIKNMLGKADSILIGGGMAYTLLKARGVSIGNSLLDESSIPVAEEILKEADEKSIDLLLPVDHIVTDDINMPQNAKPVSGQDIPEGMMGVDIGEETVRLFSEKISSAKTIVINGPMGVFETEEFAGGTRKILQAITDATGKGGSSIAGGGDTVSAIMNLDVDVNGFSHISTGGGASLKFLEGKELPGIKILEN